MFSRRIILNGFGFAITVAFSAAFLATVTSSGGYPGDVAVPSLPGVESSSFNKSRNLNLLISCVNLTRRQGTEVYVLRLWDGRLVRVGLLEHIIVKSKALSTKKDTLLLTGIDLLNGETVIYIFRLLRKNDDPVLKPVTRIRLGRCAGSSAIFYPPDNYFYVAFTPDELDYHYYDFTEAHFEKYRSTGLTIINKYSIAGELIGEVSRVNHYLELKGISTYGGLLIEYFPYPGYKKIGEFDTKNNELFGTLTNFALNEHGFYYQPRAPVEKRIVPVSYFTLPSFSGSRDNIVYLSYRSSEGARREIMKLGDRIISPVLYVDELSTIAYIENSPETAARPRTLFNLLYLENHEKYQFELPDKPAWSWRLLTYFL